MLASEHSFFRGNKRDIFGRHKGVSPMYKMRATEKEPISLNYQGIRWSTQQGSISVDNVVATVTSKQLLPV